MIRTIWCSILIGASIGALLFEVYLAAVGR